MDLQFLTAVLIIACGCFILIYGSMLFKFVLAVGGFYVGFILAGMIPMSDSTTQFLFQVVAGGILAVVAFSLVKFALNIAGALLGFVIGLFVNSLFGLEGGYVAMAVAIAGAAVGGIFGDRLGDWITILACAITGSYAIVGGMNMLFTGAKATAIPATLPAITAFLIFAIVGALAQREIISLRRRVLRI